MPLTVKCQAFDYGLFGLKRVRGVWLVIALVGLFLALAAGCVQVSSQVLDQPMALTYAAAAPRGGSWTGLAALAVAAGCASLVFAFWRLRQGARRARPLDRQDLALLRTARDAVAMLFRRHQEGQGPKGGPGDGRGEDG